MAQYRLFFPHEMDFRGRVYPIPRRLNHMGDDVARGLLKFADPKPLGERGLYWLKVQVANHKGKDKAPFEERVAFVDENMEAVHKTVSAPLDGDQLQWWMESENPWQCLATCIELSRAVKSGDPENYPCSLPIQQDGTCNGRQHYAALGKDIEGAKHVNVYPSDRPQDVYHDVCDSVNRMIAEIMTREGESYEWLMSTNLANKPQAKDQKVSSLERVVGLLQRIDGRVTRSIIKQTVMTTVYGVTVIGARDQIQGQLEDVDLDIPLDELPDTALILAQLTLKAVDGTFKGASQMMVWLRKLANNALKSGVPLSWVTPLGLPVMQQYEEMSLRDTKNPLQRRAIGESALADGKTVSARRHTTAFPPNYVHSLDSTHMLLTAIACHEAGISFAAVHDSYWTHPGDVDSMNALLRTVFAEMYTDDLPGDLFRQFASRLPELAERLPESPERGELDMSDVVESDYFFS